MVMIIGISHFNKFQLKLLIEECHPKEIIICFDSEEKRGSDKYFMKLWNICKKYSNYCNFSFIYDRENLLNYKDSPSHRGEDIFKELSEELARATLEETGNASLDNFKCRCTSYMLCKKYGIDVSSFNLESIPDSLKNMNSSEIRNELGSMRNAMEDINIRMGQHFENISKKAKTKDLER